MVTRTVPELETEARGRSGCGARAPCRRRLLSAIPGLRAGRALPGLRLQLHRPAASSPILLEPIKRDLGISDTAMGFLTGFAFAAFYTVAGIPIARWADRGVRRSIIAMGLAGLERADGALGARPELRAAGARCEWESVSARRPAARPRIRSSSDYFPIEKRATRDLDLQHRHPRRNHDRLPWPAAGSTSSSTGGRRSSWSALPGIAARRRRAFHHPRAAARAIRRSDRRDDSSDARETCSASPAAALASSASRWPPAVTAIAGYGVRHLGRPPS